MIHKNMYFQGMKAYGVRKTKKKRYKSVRTSRRKVKKDERGMDSDTRLEIMRVQSDLVKKVRTQLEHNKLRCNNFQGLPERHYSATPMFANKATKKHHASLKHQYLSPYQYSAEAQQSELFQWRGNVLRSQSIDRNFHKGEHFSQTFRRSADAFNKRNKKDDVKVKFNATGQISNLSTDYKIQSLRVTKRKFGKFGAKTARTYTYFEAKTYKQKFVRRKKGQDAINKKFDLVQARLTYFNMNLRRVAKLKKNYKMKIMELKDRIFQKGVKVQHHKNCQNLQITGINECQQLHLRLAEEALAQKNQIQMEYEQTYELDHHIKDLKEKNAEVKRQQEIQKNRIAELLQEIKEKQIDIRHKTASREHEKADLKLTAIHLGLSMQNFNINAQSKTEFQHGLEKSHVKNPKFGFQLLDYRDQFFNLHSKR